MVFVLRRVLDGSKSDIDRYRAGGYRVALQPEFHIFKVKRLASLISSVWPLLSSYSIFMFPLPTWRLILTTGVSALHERRGGLWHVHQLTRAFGVLFALFVHLS